jgi:hypothetical protein
MNIECQDFLNLLVKPALSGAREASWILGVDEDWILVLVQGRHLPMAGGHEPGCQFYFSTARLLQLAEDPGWLDRAVCLVRRTFQKKNRAASRQRSVTEAFTRGTHA